LKTTHTLDRHLYNLVHQGPHSVEQLADRIGRSANYLYKMANPAEGADFKLKDLIPAMTAQKDYQALRHLAHACGFLIVNVPRAAKNRAESMEMVVEYQKLASDTTSKLFEFLQDPTPELQTRVMALLTQVAEHSIGIRKRVADGNQLELEIK